MHSLANSFPLEVHPSCLHQTSFVLVPLPTDAQDILLGCRQLLACGCSSKLWVRPVFVAWLQHVLPGKPGATLQSFHFFISKEDAILPINRVIVRVKWYTRCEKKKLAHCPAYSRLLINRSFFPSFSAPAFNWWVQNPHYWSFYHWRSTSRCMEFQNPHFHSLLIPPEPYPGYHKLPQLKSPKPWNSRLWIVLTSPHAHFLSTYHMPLLQLSTIPRLAWILILLRCPSQLHSSHHPGKSPARHFSLLPCEPLVSLNSFIY